ncbi:MAG: type II toxin-antitoxin system VapC family toxin [Verrucomicrobiota bacterium]
MIVVDNSVAAAWFLNEQDDYAEKVLGRLDEGETMLVPSLWILEITNTMLVMARRRQITRVIRLSALEQIRKLPVRLASGVSIASLGVLEELATRHQLSAYDAEYLRVAIDNKAPLASNDKALNRAAEKEGVNLFVADES